MSVRRRIAARREAADQPPNEQQLLLDSASAEDRRIIDQAVSFSMTGIARLLALVDAVRYCTQRGIPGAFAECGVWRGGSVLAMILTLQDMDAAARDIYLYDTFEGMTEPTSQDTSVMDGIAAEHWHEAQQVGERPWKELFNPDTFNEESVRSLVLSTGYPADRLHFVRGPVEETLPGHAPESLALLRLDTDWYESTWHEMTHLFPRLQPGGVLIIDDYGHWQGARLAVDQYFATEHPPLMLNRIDYTGRIAIRH